MLIQRSLLEFRLRHTRSHTDMPRSRYKNRPIFASIALAVLFVHGPASAAPEYFRYKNDAGVTVIDKVLPPEFVKNGYEVISESGRLLRKVAAQATEEEIAANREEREKQRLAKEQRRKDELLLRRYSSVADIEASQNRVVDEITVRLSILRGNLRSVKSQIERQQEEAANAERAGREVPQRLIDNIQTMEVEVDDTRANIRARKREITEVKRRFAEDIERFGYLQDLRYGRVKQETAAGG